LSALFLNGIVFNYFCLQSSEIIDIFDFLEEEKIVCYDILLGKLRGHFILGFMERTHKHVVLWEEELKWFSNYNITIIITYFNCK
jgi:hypothetical protein